jgi:MFS family permease
MSADGSSSSSTFAALAVPNYRRYIAGQAVSLVGTWMQAIAQSWLVLELSHSGTVLGFVVAVQLLPVLVFGAYGGLIADRFDKRRILIVAQVVMGTLALILGVLTTTGAVRLWMVFVLAFALGLVRSVASPAQQSFPPEIVGPQLLGNAVSLNQIVVNTARAVGPAVAGTLIATVGVGVCFLVNAASFVAVIFALARMDRATLQPAERVMRASGQIREGLRYVRSAPELLLPLVMMAVVGTLAYEFQVVLPLMARGPLHGGPTAYGLMTSAMGAGAVCGGLVLAPRVRIGLGALSRLSFAFGVAILAAAAAPTIAVEIVVLLAVGAASTCFLTTASSTLQLTSEPQFRGRVMALWTMAFLGSTPIGGPIIGAISEAASPRAGLVTGAGACIACSLLGAVALRRVPTGRRPAPGDRVVGGHPPAPEHPGLATDCEPGRVAPAGVGARS